MAYIETRKTSDGQTRYRVQVRLRGHPLQTATFDRKTDARRWAQNTEAAIREGRHFPSTVARRRTAADLIDRYVEQVMPRKPRSARAQIPQLAWWKSQIGSYALSQVTPAVVSECRDKLASQIISGGKPRDAATVNRYLAVLAHAFTVAVKEWQWLRESPVPKVSRLKESKGRVRFLSDDERTRLLQACRESRNPLLYPIVVLALSTGMRQGEILSLRWHDVDLRRQVIILPHTKSGDRRAVPLAGHAHGLLRELWKGRPVGVEHVFPAKGADRPLDIRMAWKSALERAEIEDFRFHDLRHTAASYLAMNGASLAEIADLIPRLTVGRGG